MANLKDFNKSVANSFVRKALAQAKSSHTMVVDEYLESLLKGDQPSALSYVKEFLKSDVQECTICGFPGVGKTFLMECIKKEYQGNVLLIAPTHKAKFVLQASTGCKAETIHRVNGLRPNVELDSFKLDNLTLSLGGPVTLVNADLVLSDESSMLTNDFVKLNKLHMRSDAKIIYVGDFYQLPPVDRKTNCAIISPVFSFKWLFRMTQVLRQVGDNPLLPLLGNLRYDIDNETNTASDTIANKRTNLKSGEGYDATSLALVVQRAIRMIKMYRDKDEYSAYRMLSYGNPSTQELNNIIRKQVVTDKQCVVVGDFVTSYTTIYDENMQPIIINSMDYLVKSARPYVDNIGMKCFITLLETVDTNSDDYCEVPAVFVDTYDNFTMKVYMEKVNLLSEATMGTYGTMKSAAYRKLYDFKHSHLIIGKTIGITKPEFDYGYALTVHKSQGSTYKEVGVYYKEICNSSSGSLNKRLLHTAMSRAKHRADLII